MAAIKSHLVGVVCLVWLVSGAWSVQPRVGDARRASQRLEAGIELGPSSLLRARRNSRTSECGQRGSAFNTLIAGGEDATFGEFPWHVGVYRAVANNAHVQDCGGTLVSHTVAITAAHCFWDESIRKLKPHTWYKIALGKHLLDWNHKEDGLQIREVAGIALPKRYRGRGSNFQYDIAVVKLASSVKFTATIKPICMDWSKQYEDTQLSTGNNGTAVGWGVTLNNTAAEVLQKVELPVVDFDTCFDSLADDVKKLYTDDKFCAGFANKSRSVCRGDSGGGLVFSDANERYYLRGVVSVSFRPADNRDPCYSQLYAGFTLVSQYLPWIKTFVDLEDALNGTVTTIIPQREDPKSEKPTTEVNVDAIESECHAALQECNRLRCPHGFERFADAANCQRCRCRKVCQGHFCEEGKQCAIETFQNQTTGDTDFRAVCRQLQVHETCLASKDRGSCNNFTEKWFFDTELGICSRFWYGGCGGNDNRFESQEDCNGTCVAPPGKAACSLSKVKGPCEDSILNMQWYYDSQRKLCAKIINNECLGNNNRFQTLEECQGLCVDTSETAGLVIHPECKDNPFFANCNLIVQGQYCWHKYYTRFCCKSCTDAGQLPLIGPHLDGLTTSSPSNQTNTTAVQR